MALKPNLMARKREEVMQGKGGGKYYKKTKLTNLNILKSYSVVAQLATALALNEASIYMS